ncbi:hypothetical protein [Terrihabitans rhizophilus]|uniref:hypothetical protein n=1 Tax=Terrihabitans rhizophilus TaxID=3092662 RepID=UPI0029DE60D8|nr:hypothetical protein [Terrihabitans sp. PJ23]
MDEEKKATAERAAVRVQKAQDREREGAKAMAEYQAETKAVSDRTAKLREQRLAREAEEEAAKAAAPPAPTKAAKPKAPKPVRSKSVAL